MRTDGRAWEAEPGAPLWTLQIHDELALPGTERIDPPRPVRTTVDGVERTGQLVGRRRAGDGWWGLCLLEVEWSPGRWQDRLHWRPAREVALLDAP